MNSVLELVVVFVAIGVAAWLPRAFAFNRRKRWRKPTTVHPAGGPAMDL